MSHCGGPNPIEPRMKSHAMPKNIASLLIILFASHAAQAGIYTFTSLDAPGSTGTDVYGISGGNIVGQYNAGSSSYGFLYNGTTWTTLNDPSATNWTAANGISGGNIVGQYSDGSRYAHGYTYNGTTFTTLDDPLTGHAFFGAGTGAQGIDGSKV